MGHPEQNGGRREISQRQLINQILCIDCVKGIPKIEEDSVHLIVTSPPYYNAKDYSHWECYSDYLIWLESVFSHCYRVLKPGRMCCVNISVIIEPRKNRASESRRLALPFHFVVLMERIGFRFLEDIIWKKPEGSAKNRNGRFSLDRQPLQYKPNVVNEYILVFQKPASLLIDALLHEYRGECREGSLIEKPYERTNIWEIMPEQSPNHPAPFPMKLCRKLVLYYSFRGDVVLDPFMGSGTTAICCIETGRLFCGFEINASFCRDANERVDAVQAQQKLY